jgi:hypothetical protein
MTDERFELFITVDRNLQFQQNLERFAITIMFLCAKNNRRNTLKAFIPRIFDTLAEKDQTNLIEIFEA